tara:strand:+ start:8356 stop:8895 length:540 start_codon:yes stop_codon:yes gene_type:complete
MLKLNRPASSFRFINRGIGGNTIEDLRSRWTDHVLCDKPDWLVVKIGINDCNRFMTNPSLMKQSPEEFAKIYDQILTQTREALPQTRILILSPFYLSQDNNAPDSYRGQIREAVKQYVEHAQQAAAKHRTLYCDLNEKFGQLMEHMTPCELANDAVHPNRTGTLFIAQQVYSVLQPALD